MLLALPLLTGCAEAVVPAAALTVGALPVLGRTVPDAVVSLATGRDCSVAHVEVDGVYCRRPQPAQDAPPVCTRSIGSVDCWRAAPAATPPHRMTADGPPPAPAEAGWPWSLLR